MFAIITAFAASGMTPATGSLPRSINQDCIRATYTRRIDADGTVHLKGRYRDEDRTPFHYRVQGRTVVGTVGGAEVRFEMPPL